MTMNEIIASYISNNIADDIDEQRSKTNRAKGCGESAMYSRAKLMNASVPPGRDSTGHGRMQDILDDVQAPI
jgi:hypothetical protein